MIRLKRVAAPVSLTATLVSTLTNEFLADNKKAVWNRPDIREGLLSMSNKKCAYCESYLDEKSQYMEVDHFQHKSKYPNLVASWGNLLPACKHCNTSKGSHDVLAEPIVEPTSMDPRDHLTISNFRFYGKTSVGHCTKETLNLNDYKSNVSPRFIIGQKLADYAEELDQMCSDYQIDPNTRRRNTLLRKLRRALQEANPASEYAAISATVLLKDQHFQSAISKVRVLGLWDNELNHLYLEAESIVYL